MTTLVTLLLWTVLVSALLVGTAVLTVRWAWRRTRRAVSVAVSARTNRVRAVVPGPGREVAALRRDLQADVAGAGRAVTAGRQAGRPVEALGGITRRLAEQARALDVDLAVIGAEPDRSARRQLLAAQQERVALLRRSCAQVRRGVLLAGSVTTAALLPSLVADLDDEVVLLGLRARAYAELQPPLTR
jgi:hypothetical protein